MSRSEPDDPLLDVTRDLREIESLAESLPDEATHKGADSTAMVMLGPVANLEAWQHRIDTAWEQHMAVCERDDCTDCDVAPHAMDGEGSDWEPPLQTLEWWSEQWRVEHNRETDRRGTVATEAGFLRSVLDWAYDHEPRFADFTRDIHQARLRLENELRAGERAERTQVPCTNRDCDTRPRLIKVYCERAEADHYKCPACKHRYDEDAYKRAHAKHLRSEGSERYVLAADARSMLRDLGRSERTIRKWFETCAVRAYCNAATHEVWCWWPDLWHLHLATQTRRRVA